MLMVVHKFRDWVLEGWVSKYNLSMFDSSSQPETFNTLRANFCTYSEAGVGTNCPEA